MRTSTILGLLLLATLSAPAFASAQTVIGASCSVNNPCGGGTSCVPDDYGNPICVGGGGTGAGTVNSGTGAGTVAPSVSLINPLKGVNCASGNGNCLAAFLNSILDFVIQIGSILIVLMVVFVGYKFVVAQGAPGEIEKARTMLLWTLVGALVLLGAKAISLGILATVNALGG